ncbi:hypothetical protein B0H10DRAFT_2047395, partial [Mycena sp. CBHHK59/15]
MAASIILGSCLVYSLLPWPFGISSYSVEESSSTPYQPNRSCPTSCRRRRQRGRTSPSPIADNPKPGRRTGHTHECPKPPDSHYAAASASRGG